MPEICRYPSCFKPHTHHSYHKDINGNKFTFKTCERHVEWAIKELRRITRYIGKPSTSEI